MKKKKKFAGVLVLAVCALLASAGQVLALSASSPYHVSAIVPGESVSWGNIRRTDDNIQRVF